MVDCVFVLSGIVMWFAHPALMRQPNWADVRSFLIARVASIYPLHIVMLAALAGMVWAVWFGFGVWPVARPKFTGGTFRAGAAA